MKCEVRYPSFEDCANSTLLSIFLRPEFQDEFPWIWSLSLLTTINKDVKSSLIGFPWLSPFPLTLLTAFCFLFLLFALFSCFALFVGRLLCIIGNDIDHQCIQPLGTFMLFPDNRCVYAPLSNSLIAYPFEGSRPRSCSLTK